MDISQNHPNISHVLEAIATCILDGMLTYRDAEGSEKSVKADSVIIYAGLKSRMDEAIKFSVTAGQGIFPRRLHRPDRNLAKGYTKRILYGVTGLIYAFYFIMSHPRYF